MINVAAYCRVSTGDDSQINSYKNQIAYYSSMINDNPDWQMIDIFADQGISGTGTRNRTEFLRMMKVCRQGRINIILCKSISRFARNTVDCLKYVRELKSLGISVIFEKENINTGSENSEFMITLFAAFAQAESESISKNITWGIEKKYKEGIIDYKLRQVMGYRVGSNGKPEIIEDEAIYVRMIFNMFIDGFSMGQIANRLNDLGVKRRNSDFLWIRKHIEQILKNEKYCGMAIQQKTVTLDCISHTRVKNTGQKPIYVHRNAHDAIISEETFQKAQEMFAKRSIDHTKKISPLDKKKIYPFRGLLSCPYCGSNFRRVPRKYKGLHYALWRCGTRLECGTSACPLGASIREETLKQLLLEELSKHINSQEQNTSVISPEYPDVDRSIQKNAIKELYETGFDENSSVLLNIIFKKIYVSDSGLDFEYAYKG